MPPKSKKGVFKITASTSGSYVGEGELVFVVSGRDRMGFPLYGSRGVTDLMLDKAWNVHANPTSRRWDVEIVRDGPPAAELLSTDDTKQHWLWMIGMQNKIVLINPYAFTDRIATIQLCLQWGRHLGVSGDKPVVRWVKMTVTGTHKKTIKKAAKKVAKKTTKRRSPR